MTPTEQLEAAARQAADALLERLNHARAVVIATEDGFQVACATREALDASRLAAIASSMSAIGDVVTRETNLGAVRCLMIEADDGYLVMRATRREDVGLVVAALTSREALLGLVIHGVGETAQELAR
jgi:predicted regulator of Ras-like GTPase activity (Roadblock/LC7/MglB family)